MAKNPTPDDDMPDLDLLIDKNSLEKDLPPVDPASILKKPAAETRPPANTPPPPVRSNRRAYRVPLSTGGLARAEEMLSVLRDTRDGRLMVQINDKAYRSLTEDPEVKARFIQLMRELNDTVSKIDDNPPSQEDLEAVVEDFNAPPPPIDADGGMPGDLPRYTLEESMRPTRTGRYESTPMPELNIPQAIESYLQHKLKYTPGFEGRQLHVLSAPGGGVRIQVDDRFFEAVGDVDEPDVREFLSATIQEWQARQG